MKKNIENFKKYCEKNNLRITEPRLATLRIVQKARKPITAYEILDLMGKDLNNPKPPTAYRALDFLIIHGFVHRIESMNAYMVCGSDHDHHGSQFTICDKCNMVEEIHMDAIPQSLQEKATGHNFNIKHWSVEIHGTCSKCLN